MTQAARRRVANRPSPVRIIGRLIPRATYLHRCLTSAQRRAGTAMCWGFERGDGCFALADELCADLQRMTDEQVLPQPMSMLPLRFPVTRLTYGAQQVFSQSVPIDASLDPWGVKVDPPLQTQDFCEDHRSMTSRTLFDASWTFLIEEMTGETEIATFVLSQTSTLKLKIKFEVQREQWLALVHSGEEKMAQHRSASELIGDTLLTRTEVQRLLKIGKTALYEGMKSGLIPEGIRLMNGRTRRWWLSDIKKILGI